MSNNLLLKITNNSTALTAADNGVVVGASVVFYLPLDGNLFTLDGAGNIERIQVGYDKEIHVGTDVTKIELGHIGKSGVFSTILTS